MCVTPLNHPAPADLTTSVTNGCIDSSQDYASRRTVSTLQKTQKTQNLTDTGCDEDGKLRDLTVVDSSLPPDGNGNTLFAAVANLDVCLTVQVHAALVLAAQRPELYGRTRRTTGKIALRRTWGLGTTLCVEAWWRIGRWGSGRPEGARKEIQTIDGGWRKLSDMCNSSACPILSAGY